MLSFARLRARHLRGTLLAASALLCGAGASALPAAPSISPAEARTIAEEGFIYGLPMVMDYAVMNDFVINRDSGAWKAPFNQLRNEADGSLLDGSLTIYVQKDSPGKGTWSPPKVIVAD